MKITPKFGIDKLVFGMKQADVEALLGTPDKKFQDEEENTIYAYNKEKCRLSFYADEDFRLGFIITSNEDATLNDLKVIGLSPKDVKQQQEAKGIKGWEVDNYDVTDTHFNEDNWIVLHSEYNIITKLELGATFNAQDEFDFKFPKKK
ncbi:MAG: hypothetical protein ACOH1O_02460 [Flavobacterium sp.]